MHNTKRDPNVNCGRWPIMMAGCMFITVTLHQLVGVWTVREAVLVSGCGTWGISVLSLQFCFESKTALKNSLFFF